MNERFSDNLVERVIKKVDELKLWQLKNDKDGFEKVYKDVLKEVEELPESAKKQYALADVLMRGWWWLPGKKNDALFARIADAAIQGKNEEVMTFIVSREDFGVPTRARIEFIRDKQIPRLEKAGFVKALGREWFWLGHYLSLEDKHEEAANAWKNAEKILTEGDLFRALLPKVKTVDDRLASYCEDDEENFRLSASAEEIRIIDGYPRFWSKECIKKGHIGSLDSYFAEIFENASACDRQFVANIKTGETVIGSDGTALTYVSDSETVDTPSGSFENCQLWEIKRLTDNEKIVCKTYYKVGIGIVRQEQIVDGVSTTLSLKAFDIKGGQGIIPMQIGNRWSYTCDSTDAIRTVIEFEISYADGEGCIISSFVEVERSSYDENSWFDAVQEISQEYFKKENGRWLVKDVEPAIRRAEMLAVTACEKAHTRAAASVARRIMATDPTFNPEYTATGHWNFFGRQYVRCKKDSITITDYNGRWGFELKNTGLFGTPEYAVLYNDVYGILFDAMNCIWSDEWQIGASKIVEYPKYSYDVRTEMSCTDGGEIITKAGSFKNCLKISLDIGGMSSGHSYRGGKKTYYFADGVGIVRTENEYASGTRVAVYELTSYEGKSQGYMPIEDGFMRRYDAVNLTDGFEASAVYTFVKDGDGDIVMYSDRTGIRNLPPPITQYSAIQSEITEDELWDAGKREESRLLHDLNNFNILCHFFGRCSRYWGRPDKAVAWNKYRIRIMEGLDESGVPDAWLGHYAATCFRTACALFGIGKKEEGYEWLDKAHSQFEKWESIPSGAEMSVGDPFIYGGIKIVKGKDIIKLPSGKLEPIDYEYLFTPEATLLHRGMTATSGWEWFDSVREEKRFKEYVEKAKAFIEK